jgi:formylglycine-generating enzyme required for sulfatase activity
VGDSSSVPPRVVAVSSFWIDSNEVTVARLRAAVGAGLAFDRQDDLLTTDKSGDANCMWTSTAGAAEDFAVTCISWYGARAFCQFVGGDLPTEAQWEYAATGGGGFKTTFPWGYDAPQCSCATDATDCHAPVFGRQSDGLTAAQSVPACPGTGPLSTPANVGPQGDTSPVGISGLAGGVSEWVKDSEHSYASPCWLGASVIDPVCWEPEALARSWRGGAWFMPIEQTLPVVRSGARPGGTLPYDSIGFRCAYAQAPR